MDSVGDELDAWVARMDGVDPQVEAARQRIGRISRAFTELLHAVAREQGISVGDWEALSVLVRDPGPCAPSTLARSLGLTAGTVTTRLRRLTGAGLVEQVPDADGRSRPVRLTDAGYAAWRDATAARTRAEAELFGVLSASDLAATNALLGRLLERLESEVGPVSRHDVTGAS
ncbi:MarR family winged helix-turn-helix transcriptional regulator [Pseudonocardia phyllosphaerae]|uniref:MarR family winged helix-turn-helix transcriptional regulator n=1 Tax=Pseudonocardia phyllosphaerae TaxID=3390502 RepID=UPI00397D2339